MASLTGSSKLTATWRSSSFSLLLSVYFTAQSPFWLIRRHSASLWYNKSDNFFKKMSVIWFLFRRKNNVVVNFLVVVNFSIFFSPRSEPGYDVTNFEINLKPRLHLFIYCLWISLYINLCIWYNKQLSLYINLCLKKQHVFLSRSGDLSFVYTFQTKSSLM